MVADEGQRKLAAILAADVAGYSRLMADDERATVRTLTAYRTLFSEYVGGHQGRIVDTAGDSVLATFDSMVEAVEAAVEIQRALANRNQDLPGHRRMHFRVGVNLGDIIVRDDGTIYGDGVNVAARLEGLAEPGGIMISGSAHEQIEGKLDVSLADAGTHDVKNIPRLVRAYRVHLTADEATDAPRPKLRRRAVPLGVSALVAAIIVASAVWWFALRDTTPPMLTADGIPTDDPILAMPTGPSIAVLPFNNINDDTGHEYFADGITEDIITRLSHFPDYMVIARNTTFQYKGRAIDVGEVARELSVDFVLEGSVRRDETRVRITAQLIDGNAGSHLWANSFDGDLTAGDIFDIQDAITEQVVTTLADTYGVISLAGYKRSLVRGSADLSAYECVLGAHGYYGSNTTPTEHARVRDCLERAVEIAPDYADAWAWLAAMYRDEHMVGFNAKPNALVRAEDAARKAVNLDPQNVEGNLVLAHVRFFKHDIPGFLVSARRTVSINPNSADALASMGMAMGYAGYWEEGLAWTTKAMKLNPRFPPWFQWVFFYDRFRNGEYEVAAERAELGVVPGFYWSNLMQAAAYGKLGRLARGRSAVMALTELYPGYDLEMAEELHRTWNFDDALIADILDGLRKAGLPEPSFAPSRPVIAVLPFDNLSGDPEQDYFSDGITEDIITRLAQVQDILVLGRNTSFQFKGEAIDIETVAQKLGADYVVEGSIRRGGNTVRVTAQLLNGDDGTHLWVETYDRALDPANLFAIQDEITAAVASRIGDPSGAINRAEFQRSVKRAPSQLASYDCVLRYFEYLRVTSELTFRTALDCLESTVAADTNFADALTFLGDLYVDDVAMEFGLSPHATLRSGLNLIQQGVAADPKNGVARVRLARALLLNDQPERAIREAEQALQLAPNNTDVLGTASVVFTNSGQYDRARETMEKVAVLNPNYSAWMNWEPAKGHLARGNYAEAIRSIEKTEMLWWSRTKIFMAAALCANGDTEQGRQMLDKALEEEPNLAEVHWQKMYFWHKGRATRPLLDAVAKGLEACGWNVPPDPGPEAFAVAQ